jgi:hypothetical protein
MNLFFLRRHMNFLKNDYLDRMKLHSTNGIIMGTQSIANIPAHLLSLLVFILLINYIKFSYLYLYSIQQKMSMNLNLKPRFGSFKFVLLKN